MQQKSFSNTGVSVPEVGLGTWNYHAGVEPLRKGLDAGAFADKCAAIASSMLAIRSALPFVNASEGRFVAPRVALREAALAAVFRTFLLMSQLPDGAGLSGLGTSRKRPK